MRWLPFVLLTGCYSPTVADGVACGIGDTCPSGQRCVDGVCTKDSDGTDASVGGDDASREDAAIDAMLDAPSAVAPQFVAFAFDDAAGTTATVQVPAGVIDGDLLLLHVAADLVAASNINAPNGWTLVIERDGVQDQHYAGIYYRRATAGTSSYSWTFTNNYGALYLMAFRNVNLMPIDASAAVVNNDSVTPTVPSVTTTRAQTLLVVTLTQDLSRGPFTPFPNMTEVYSRFTGELMVLAAHVPVPAPGATGIRTTATDDIGPTIGFSVALAPL